MTLVLSKKGKSYFIEGDETPAIYPKLLGTKSWVSNGRIKFSPLPKNVRLLNNNFPSLKLTKELVEILDESNRLKDEYNLTISQKEEFTIKDDYDFKMKPFDHQMKAFYIGRDSREFAYLFDPGCGKTKVTLDNAGYLYQKGEIDLLVVIAPNGVNKQWFEESIDDHLVDSVPRSKALYRSNETKKNVLEFNSALNAEKCLNIIVFNVDVFSGEKHFKKLYDIMASRPNSMFVVDESTRIKNGSAKRTKNILKLSKLAKYKRILTGTVITNGIEDLYYQFNFLNPSILGFDNFTAFKNRYCEYVRMQYGDKTFPKLTGYKNIEEIRKRIDGFSYRAKISECLNLPPLVVSPPKFVDMASEQREIYNEMRVKKRVTINGELIETDNPVTTLVKLRQIISGFITNEDGDVIKIKHNKLDTLVEMINGTDEKIIVWGYFKYDLESIERKLKEEGIKHILYEGSEEERFKKMNEFKSNPDIKVLISTPKRGGIGLNIQEATISIYYSRDYNFENREQAKHRTYRAGQTKTCVEVDLLTDKTVDFKIRDCLIKKKNISKMIEEEGENFYNEI